MKRIALLLGLALVLTLGWFLQRRHTATTQSAGPIIEVSKQLAVGTPVAGEQEEFPATVAATPAPLPNPTVCITRPSGCPSFSINLAGNQIDPVHHLVRQRRAIYLTDFSGHYLRFTDGAGKVIFESLKPLPKLAVDSLGSDGSPQGGQTILDVTPTFSVPNLAGKIEVFKVVDGVLEHVLSADCP